jgi:hypothetical protein
VHQFGDGRFAHIALLVEVIVAAILRGLPEIKRELYMDGNRVYQDLACQT